MSVYVNTMRYRKHKTRKRPHSAYCHMTADSREELFEMALRLRLQWEWFHQTKKKIYFPLTAARRRLAVEYGAIETDDRRRKVEDR